MTGGVGVVGATGFVGSYVVRALESRGVSVFGIRAPRITGDMAAADYLAERTRLTRQLDQCSAAVNAAGLAQAVSSTDSLDGANHLMPALVGEVSGELGIRLVHISSAAVQGRRPVLDETANWDPFSPYSASKAAGEQALLGLGSSVCIYRPPGVHARDRHLTRALVRFASSPLASVAHPGTANTPQALAANVAHAVAHLATVQGVELPPIVHHPSEGLTTSSLLIALGGRSPRVIPSSGARAAVTAMYVAARARPGLEGQARRAEVLWFGQKQAPSWLTQTGWSPIAETGLWKELGSQVRADLETNAQPALRSKS